MDIVGIKLRINVIKKIIIKYIIILNKPNEL